MSIFWYSPLLVILIFILYYNFKCKRGISRPAEFFRLLIASVIAVATLVLFLWVFLGAFDTNVKLVSAAALGSSITFLLKDPGVNLRQF
ncbi:MAG TPA: hypothetical protein VMX75_12065 [Spirochaetia bacterium]|nr:hypothetical protein [Spirochaetia bacterium]